MLKTARKMLRFLMIIAMVLNIGLSPWAQTIVVGALRGTVQDNDGQKPIPGAAVFAVNQDTGLSRTTLTRIDGTYFFANLPPGEYEVTAKAAGYENISNDYPSVLKNISISITKTQEIPLPPIALQKLGVTSTLSSKVAEGPSEILVNKVNATREGGFGRRELLLLPLPGVRSFDDLAFLLPGVAPPPQAIGTNVGPGVGPGVGTSGQFSVNGMRSRSNNFTIDGSDNNDEDIGVRRQGFTSLVPQSIESVQEFQAITLLPEPQFGRTPGAQVNAVSRSGGTDFHGTLYGFFTNQGLRARDPFDYIGGPPNYLITGESNDSLGKTVRLDGNPLAPANPVEGENPFRRAQYGFTIGGPIIKNKLSFFGSFERQDINARRESHFAVPRVAERGLTVRNVDDPSQPILTGDRGIAEGGFRGKPTSAQGDAFFSLYPFPNNPQGPYGRNTYTEVLPADAEGNVFSGKFDWQNIKAFGKEHNLTGRYNFTDDDTILPVTGGAIFSSLEPLVRTQNLSLFFDTAISSKLTNQFRASYGRTHLDFKEVPKSKLPSSILLATNTKDQQGNPFPFLLNSEILSNDSRVGLKPGYSTTGMTTEEVLGPLGQLVVSGYSPVGVDVFNFPQARVNNVFQYANTLIYAVGKQQFTAGFDLRRVQLNSRLDRNFRPLAVFTGAPTSISKSTPGIPLETVLQGRDFVAVGAPTGFTQTLAVTPDSTIGLRAWQNYFFLSDQIHLHRNLTLTIGATYQLNTVPTEVNGRIEQTFKDALVEGSQAEKIGLNDFLDGRTKIYRQDNNNIAPYISVAWDPFGKGETSIRAGYGIYYDQIPGAVVSQSRSVFPSFFTFNLAGISAGVKTLNTGLDFLNPSLVSLVGSGTLNKVNLTIGTPGDIISGINRQLTDILKPEDQSGFARPDFVLPSADLVTPYAHHWGLTIEQQLKKDFLLSVAYVGTRGVHLLRFATPNLGANKILVVKKAPPKRGEPVLEGEALPIPNAGPSRQTLGAFTSIMSDADSTYHALQVQLNKRFSRGIQLTTSYTWSHALDEVSELFDLAGAPALPQNSFDLSAEHGDANYDLRHRFVYSVIWDLPGFRNNWFLSGWQAASIGTFQTGQPYSVLYFYDRNQDGNLTDRITPEGTLVGQAGRNLFRAPKTATVDFALNKTFRFSEKQNIEFRTEIFNLFNRKNFGVPVNQVDFGGLGFKPLTEKTFVETRVPMRTIQFALKYNF